MSPMHKSLTALAAAAMLATVGYATAQSTDSTQPAMADTTAAQPADASSMGTTTTTTTTDTTTQVIPAPPTGVVELAKPAGTVAPVDKQPDGAFGMANTVMTTGVTTGATRPSIGDHATPPIEPAPTTLAVTTERTTTTTVTPAPAPAPVPEAAPAPEPTPEPAPAPEMPAPRADRN